MSGIWKRIWGFNMELNSTAELPFADFENYKSAKDLMPQKTGNRGADFIPDDW